jgi:hypothetical protein
MLREKYGDDLVILTTDQAHEKGLALADFANVPTMQITAPPVLHVQEPFGAVKCGKTKRRERRADERRTRK